MDPIAFPPELLEHIFLQLGDVFTLSILCKVNKPFNSIVEGSFIIWPAFYLDKWDDPRPALATEPRFRLGRNSTSNASNYDWKTNTKKRARAESVVEDHLILKRLPSAKDRENIYSTLIDIAYTAAPFSPFESKNVIFLHTLYMKDSILQHSLFSLSSEEEQLRDHLHVLIGLTNLDLGEGRGKRYESRVYVYDLRHYHDGSLYGPYLEAPPSTKSPPTEEDEGERDEPFTNPINWTHLHHIHTVFNLNFLERTAGLASILGDVFGGTGRLMNITHVRSDSAPAPIKSPEADKSDWPGLEGRWQCGFCYCDHRELMRFNSHLISPNTQPNPILNSGFTEILRILEFDLRVLALSSTAKDEEFPPIHFEGRMAIPETDGEPAGGGAWQATIVGTISLTECGEVRWRFVGVIPATGA